MRSGVSRFLLCTGILLFVLGPFIGIGLLFARLADISVQSTNSDLSSPLEAASMTVVQEPDSTVIVPNLPIDRPLPMESLGPITPVEDVGLPQRIQIKRVGINARVVTSTVMDGKYTVPSFAAGHHVDSPLPGNPGNAVLNGHIESINAGYVFAALPQVREGDAIEVTSEKFVSTWEVTSVKHVDRSDASWMIGGAEPILTLYTCTGPFDWKSRDYTERLIVVARRIGMEPRPGMSTT